MSALNAVDVQEPIPVEVDQGDAAAGRFGKMMLLAHSIIKREARQTGRRGIVLKSWRGPAGGLCLRLPGRRYRFEGRFADVRQVLRRSWCRSPDPAGVLQELWLLDHSPMPAEAWGAALEKANGEDDRVWLGRARLSLLTGKFPESARWLSRCEKRRPDDPAVWQVNLDLALAADDVTRFWKAAAHQPAGRVAAPDLHAIRAWLAERQGNRQAQRRELERLVRDRPGDTRAVEALAALMLDACQPHEAERLHRLKSQGDAAKDRIRKILLDERQMLPHASELGRLSRTLSRDFDAAAWSLLEQGKATSAGAARIGFDGSIPVPEAVLVSARELSARSALPDDPAPGSPETLADRLADLHFDPTAGPERPSSLTTDHDPPASSFGASRPRFQDDAESVGLRFLFDSGQTPEHLLHETMAGGVGLIDYDGDGWLDVYCIQGGTLNSASSQPGLAVDQKDRLFRNRGNGTFQDVTAETGLEVLPRDRGFGLGVAVGDCDNDGFPDLLLTRLRSYVLLRNRGGRTFEDVTAVAGLAGLRDNPTSAAFADLDNDGRLDLYICHYMRWDPEHPQLCQNDKGEYFYCDPSKVEPAPDHVFRNLGGRFTEVTEAAGFVDPGGRGLGVVAADVNGDNLVDLFVSNDGTANYLFLNKGGLHFEESALTSGVAGNAGGGYQAGMGVICGDLDGDGLPDLMVNNFYGEGTTLYRNLGQDLFTDASAVTGIGLATRYLLGFGIDLVDVANRGRLDVLITNGHVNDNRPFYPYAMPSRLYENRPGKGGFKLVDVSEQAGPAFQVARVGRGLAAGDLDNDGRVDALILPLNEPLAYFHNLTENPGHFVTLRLEGTRSNRDGVGARVTVVAGRHRQVAQRLGGGSFQSASDSRLHFGIGDRSRVDSVEVRWPSGRVDQWTDLAADTGYLLREGASEALPLPGFKIRRTPGK